MRDRQHEIFGEGVHQREGDVLMVILAEPRVKLEIVAHIVHPAHVPLEVEAKPSDLGRICHKRPRGRLLRHHQHARVDGKRHRVERAQKVDGLEIFFAAVAVSRPFAVAASVIEIQHRRHRVHAQPVHMILAQPKRRGGEKKAPYLAFAIVEYARAPAVMLALLRFGVLVKIGSVKFAQSMLVLAKVRRHPVENDGDPLLMQPVHKIHEIMRRTVARGRRKVAGALIAPRIVQRILRDRHQLHAVVAQFGHIRRKLVGKRAVIVKAAVAAPPP